MSDPRTDCERRHDTLLAERRAKGRATYGQGLDHRDARYDWKHEALCEAMDMSQYLVAEVMRLEERAQAAEAERDALRSMLEAEQRHHAEAANARDNWRLLAGVSCRDFDALRAENARLAQESKRDGVSVRVLLDESERWMREATEAVSGLRAGAFTGHPVVDCVAGLRAENARLTAMLRDRDAAAVAQLADDRMPDPEPDEEGYPTAADLRRIREWDAKDPQNWLDFVQQVVKSCAYGTVDVDADASTLTYTLTTHGWSGIESIVKAMQENRVAWAMTWQQITRGGRHVFVVRKAWAAVACGGGA